MKKYIYFIGLSMLISINIKAQQIQNGGFESWTIQNLFNEPDGFYTSNMQALMMNANANVTKEIDSYHGTYAVKMETVLAGNDTIGGMLLIGTPGNQTINGGVPYAGTPDSISVWAKYDIQVNDTAFFIIAFKNSGNMIAQAVTIFHGTQSTYQRFVIPTNLSSLYPPDSLVAIITSSKMDAPRMPGSYLIIDSISFLHSSEVFPNGDFENWTDVSSEELDNWNTSNYAGVGLAQDAVTKSIDSYDENYAVRIETVQTTWGGVTGFITNGVFGNNGPEGGMPVSANPDKVSGYYKYIPNGTDTAYAGVFSFKYDPVGDSTIMLSAMVYPLVAASSYTYFEIPLSYNLLPVADTVNIFFIANDMQTSTTLGSVLFLDSLCISYHSIPVGVEPINNASQRVISVFPNPTDENLNIMLSQNQKGLIAKIYNVNGEIVKEIVIDRALTTINVNNLSKGLYMYRITDAKDCLMDNGKFIKE